MTALAPTYARYDVTFESGSGLRAASMPTASSTSTS